jgi:nucleotide-binding universal stress UspA family protein
MLQVKDILCPVNLAASEHPALSQALSLAERCRAHVHVVPLPASPEASRGDAPLSSASIRSALRDIIAETTSHEPVCLDAISTALDTSIPTADEVFDYVDEQSVELVVLDTPADRGAIPALASDPVRLFVTDLTVPVFVTSHQVTPCQHAAETNAPARRILVPTDFSANARVALRQAAAMAEEMNAEIDLLHVMERPQYVALNSTDMLSLSDATLSERKARRRAEKQAEVAWNEIAAGRSGRSMIDVTVHVRHGDAADQIGRFVTENQVDLMVMSTHGTISRPRNPLGHVVERVLRRVPRPVFLSRAHGPTLLMPTTEDVERAERSAAVGSPTGSTKRSASALAESMNDGAQGDGHAGSTVPPVDQNAS